ncbi:prephenate dehydrogenase [Clostridia bacterium]|nr:prephenate dehydrogenase [Clostridia bacterium]
MKQVGIVGLGLIGGSFAKAIKKFDSSIKITAFDKDEKALESALIEHSIDDYDSENLKNCDLVLICLYPQATVDFIRNNAAKLKDDALLIDICGIKKGIVYYVEYILGSEHRNDVDYVSCHPMAGRECWGYENSLASIFKNKNFLITKTPNIKESAIEKAKEFATNCGFSNIQITTPEQHDKIIALTSQLAHIVSSAYIKSPTAQYASGFTGGSFADMTRVANLNENMWAELFLQNKEYIIEELDIFEKNLEQFRYAIKGNDSNMLKSILAKGRERREMLDQLDVEN